ncbi:Sorting nexin-29 [Liparis tanakae]|uniref:Sorting nexin-29 n=1 Tax=Liparis tanakae TaxID=230148 RepID=A0A4Z2F1A6_9TELE|nr:Sorting nexin-29 [Liparis tanakae]
MTRRDECTVQDAKFVEERRKQLQGYLRTVMNKLVQTLPEFTARPTKETLLSLLPFCLISESSGNNNNNNNEFNNSHSIADTDASLCGRDMRIVQNDNHSPLRCIGSVPLGIED